MTAATITDSTDVILKLLALLFAGGLLAFIGTLLSLRSGRQKSYDDRVDAELGRLREELRATDMDRDLKAEKLSAANVEIARLKILLIDHRIDPDTGIFHG